LIEKGKVRMASVPHIVVCAGIVPDPLQTLEPIAGSTGPVLKNEIVLPAVLDSWASRERA
jgi:electron transfer flavoprotein beta subunit